MDGTGREVGVGIWGGHLLSSSLTADAAVQSCHLEEGGENGEGAEEEVEVSFEVGGTRRS